MERKKGPDRVRQALRAAGLEVQVNELPESTRTASDAAEAIGCQVGQIAKSLIFQGEESGRAYLAVASGSNQVDESKLAAHATEDLKLANPSFVRQHTGYAIGGVPPLGLAKEVRTFMDADLLDYEWIWAAAGSPRAVFSVKPGDLLEVIRAEVVDLRIESSA
jgi:prolyl-tRNA editing enzyme YbaK/EbsC (Cys-tRNA(Pro) deacylase)